MNIVSRIGLVALSCLLLHACSKTQESEHSSDVRVAVSVEHPRIQPMSEYFELNGVTQFQKKDIIRATNTGYITTMDFKPGDFIDTASVFCSVETKEQHALKNHNKNDTTLKRFQQSLHVVSNAAGTITSINVLQGDYIAEGDVLASVSEPRSLIVVVNVPFEFHSRVQTNAPCDIVLPDNNVIHTSISGTLPVVNASSQSQAFFIRLPHETLPENLNVTVRIPLRKQQSAFCVPSAAVQTDDMQQHYWLMAMQADSTVRKVPVELGIQNADWTEIKNSSLSERDLVVVRGAYGLADSTHVRVNSN